MKREVVIFTMEESKYSDATETFGEMLTTYEVNKAGNEMA